MTNLEHDYDLNKLEEIRFRGLRYFIMPRYKHHYLANNYEDFSLDIMLKDLSENSTFVDIGSHYGAYSLMAAKKAAKGRVIAIEPVQENYHVLKKNIQANKIDNVTPLNYAASNKSGQAEFNIPWASDSAGFYEHPNAETIKKVQVKMARPDDLIKGQKVDFIKIDTEGHELQVLEGLEDTLNANSKIKLLIELNPQCLANAGCTPLELINKLKELGKTTLIVNEDKRELINITSDPKRWEELVGESGYANLYCLPQEDLNYILIISHSGGSGGAELALTDLTRDLQSKGVISHFVVPAEGDMTKLLKQAAIGYSVIPFGGWAHLSALSRPKREANDAWNIKAVQEIKDLANKLQPDVIVSNTIVVPWGAVAAAVAQKPHIWMVHEYGNLDHGLIFDYDYETVLRFVDNFSDKVIANSPNIKKHLSKIINSQKILQIYQRFNSVGTASSPGGPPTNIFSKTKALKIVLVGRVTESKGQLDAIKALAEIAAAGVSAEIAFIGEVESKAYKKKIDDVIARNKLGSWVKFIGHVKDPAGLVAQADISLTTSQKEAFGRVTVEAMLAGKPVIGTNSGGTKYIIKDGVTGYLYEPGNANDLARILIQADKHKAKLKQMGSEAKRYATAEFTSDRYVNEVIKLIKSLKTHQPGDSREFLYDKFINHSRLVESRIEEIDKTKNELAAAVNRLEAEVIENRNILNNIYNSKSWRLARSLANGKHKIKRAIKK